MLAGMLWGGASTFAWAEQGPSTSRFYASVGLGWSYAEPFVMKDINAVIDYDLDPVVASIAAGLVISDRWRFELEGSFHDNAPEVLYVRGTDIELDTRGDDELRTSSFLLNAYRDFHFGTAVRPYIAVGAGAAHLHLTYTEYTPVPVWENPLVDDSTWSFAYQAIAGLSVPLSRRFDLGVEYRYWRAPDVDFKDLDGNPLNGSQAIRSGWLRLNYRPGGYDRTTLKNADPIQGRGFYLAATMGTSWGPDRDFRYIGGQFDAFDIGPMLGFAAGYQFGGHWYLELDLARQSNEMQIYDTRIDETRTKGSVDGNTLSLNLGYRFRPNRAIDPYLTVGLGASRIHYEVDVAIGRAPLIDDTVTPFSGGFSFGVDLALSERWTIATAIRGVLTDHFTLERTDGETVTSTYLMYAMTIGARYRL